MASLKYFTLFFLLFLLTKSVSSMHGNISDPQTPKNVEYGEASSSVKAPNTQTDPQTSEIVEHDKASSSLIDTDPQADSHPHASENVENDRKKEEMAAVGDNISALYIVRNIKKRAKALKVLKANAIEKMQALHPNPSQKIRTLEGELAEAKNLLSQPRSAEPIVVNVDGPAIEQIPQVVANANIRNNLAWKETAVDDLNKKLAEAKESKEIDKRLVRLTSKNELIPH
jgi:hypothetical protein